MILTAVICTYDRYRLLGDAVLSLCQQSLPKDEYRILIVDNSPDGAAARQFAAPLSGISNLRYLHVDRPGLSNARNIALREVTTPYVAFMDDDAIAATDWLENIARFFHDAKQAVAAVGGPVAPIWEAPRPTWLHDELLGYVGLLDLGDQLLEIGSRQWLIGANIAYQRDALNAVGGFRTDLGRRGTILISNEELELQARLREARFRLFYCPDVRVRHRVPPERLTQTWVRQRVFWQAISDLITNPAAEAQIQKLPRGFFAGETSSPKAFHKQCSRIMKTVKKLGAGYKAR